MATDKERKLQIKLELLAQSKYPVIRKRATQVLELLKVALGGG